MPSRSRSPLIPSDYRFLRPLGRGAQGIVSLVENRHSGDLAVHKSMTEYEMATKRWPMEPYLLQVVLPRSPRLTRLIDCYHRRQGTRPDLLVLIYEYCPGGDLQRAVDHMGPEAPEDFIWHVFIQLAEALDVLHNCGTEAVIHADLKPDNVFLVSKLRPGRRPHWPDVKLGDFGTATVGDEDEGFHVPEWQGPEIPSLSAAGDVWALGAIVHWMGHDERSLIRDPPAGFRGGNGSEWVLRPEARRPVKLPGRYSDCLNGWMMGCLRWEPRRRVSSGDLVGGVRREYCRWVGCGGWRRG